MRPYYQDDFATIYHGDCREVLPSLPNADLCFLDPPYNVGKGYDGYSDDLPEGEYVEFLQVVLEGVYADTLTWTPGALNIALALDLIYGDNGWRFNRLLAWHKKEYAGDVFHSGPAMCWEPIVWAHRTEKPYCNKVFGPWGRDCLVVNSTHGDPLRSIHPCPKPPEVLQWLIGLFCPVGGTVIDPTMGMGTALLKAKYLGRQGIGIEQSERYCEAAAQRLSQEVLDFGGAA